MQRFEDRPFTFLGMYGREGERSEIAARLSREGVSWRSAMELGKAQGGALWSRCAVRGFSQFYLVDDQGAIRGRWFGDPDLGQLATRIEALLEVGRTR